MDVTTRRRPARALLYAAALREIAAAPPRPRSFDVVRRRDGDVEIANRYVPRPIGAWAIRSP